MQNPTPIYSSRQPSASTRISRLASSLETACGTCLLRVAQEPLELAFFREVTGRMNWSEPGLTVYIRIRSTCCSIWMKSEFARCRNGLPDVRLGVCYDSGEKSRVRSE